MSNTSQHKGISILLISLGALFVTFLAFLCAYAMCPTSSDIALAQESKTSVNNSALTTDPSDEIKDNTKETTPTNNSNIDLSSNASTSRSFSDNQSDEDSYSNVNDDSKLVMHYTDLQKSLYNSLSSSQNKFLSDKKPLNSNEILSNENLDSFDLRNVDGKNYVSNVKNQSPFGSCWAFAITAASEISLQSKSNTSYEDNPIDLSEHHLAWFANNHIAASGEEGYNPSNPQSGEGGWYLNPSTKNDSLDSGGLCYFGITSFSSSVGAQKASNFPYKGVLGLVLAKLKGKYLTYANYDEAVAAGAEPVSYSDEDDWSIAEENRFTNEYNLEKSSILPSVQPTKNDEGQYILNNNAINILKNQLINGKAVSMSFASDVSMPSQESSQDTARYMNTTNWAHYTWKDNPKESTNHAVCIVGYDDNYDKNNFTVNEPAKWDKNQHVIYKLNGMNLNNDEHGNPYYTKEIEGQTVKVVLDKNSPIVELRPGSADEYKLKDTELQNNNSGKPLYPDGSGKLMPDISILCEVAKDSSGPHTPAGDGAWIVKNSWGAASQSFPNHDDWGIDGYFYLSYYDLSVKGLTTFELNEKNSTSADSSLTFAHDTMSALSAYTGYFNDDVYSDFNYANVFNASEDTVLDSVSCTTENPYTNCNISLYELNDGASDPKDGKLIYQTQETYPFAGFHMIHLSDSVLVNKDKKFSVVVNELTPFNDSTDNIVYYQSIPDSLNLSIEYAKSQGSGLYFNAIINPGESFVTYYDKTKGSQCCYDLKDFINTPDYCKMTANVFADDEERKYYATDNFPVKAYGHTVSNPSPSPTPDDPVEPNVAASTADNNMTICISLILFMMLGVVFIRLSYYKK